MHESAQSAVLVWQLHEPIRPTAPALVGNRADIVQAMHFAERSMNILYGPA